jgi:hypothetical protein
LVEGFAEASFVSSGVLLDKQETIVATRVPEFGFTKEVVATQSQMARNNREKQTTLTLLLKHSLSIRTTQKVCLLQNWMCSLEPRIRWKELRHISLLLMDKFLQNRFFHSLKWLRTPILHLRVICTLRKQTDCCHFPAGTIVTGQTSGATGVIKSVVKFRLGCHQCYN